MPIMQIAKFIEKVGWIHRLSYKSIQTSLGSEFKKESSLRSTIDHPDIGTVWVDVWHTGWINTWILPDKDVRLSLPDVEQIIHKLPFGGYRILHEDMVNAWYTSGVEFRFGVPAGELVLSFYDDQETRCEEDHNHEMMKREIFAGVARANCSLGQVAIHNQPAEETKNSTETLAQYRNRMRESNR